MVCGGKNISHHLVVLAAQALLVQVNLKQKTSFSKGLAYLPSRPLVMDLKWNIKMSSEVDFSINGEKIPHKHAARVRWISVWSRELLPPHIHS